MLFLIGLSIVVGSVLGGYTMHGGEVALLWQPSEYIIIIGSGIGAAIIGNSTDDLKLLLKSFGNLFKSKPKSKADYLELLSFSFNVFKLMKVKGMLEIESHIENPNESELFNNSPSILKDHHACDLMRDYLRMMTMGVDNPHQFENLIERELELMDEELAVPGKIMTNIGDSLPALGIVAAVLGVIITMRSVTEPPEILGSLIAAALVGTFTGVLFAYGVFLPIGSSLKHFGMRKGMYFYCMKAGLISHINGNAPVVTVEFMRKNIPEELRPSFNEADEYINSKAKIG